MYHVYRKVETWYTHEQWVDVSCIQRKQAAAAYSSHSQSLKIFITLLSGTVRCTKLELDTNMINGSVYHVYWNHVARNYSSHYFFFFLSLQFSVTNLSFSSDSAIVGL